MHAQADSVCGWFEHAPRPFIFVWGTTNVFVSIEDVDVPYDYVLSLWAVETADRHPELFDLSPGYYRFYNADPPNWRDNAPDPPDYVALDYEYLEPVTTCAPPATATPTPSQIPTPTRHAAQEGTTLQGEVAYVLDGDIWLHDLLSGDVRRLTTDGDNMAPAWSPDGRALVYSHGPDLESADLYLLDMNHGAEPELLVEQACCGAWSPDGLRIAYIDLSGDELALNAITPDGATQETLLAPLTYGRGAYPAAKMDWVDQQYLVVPLDVIGDGSLDLYRDVFTVNLDYGQVDDGLRQDECAVLNRDVLTIPGDGSGGLLAEAIAFERAGDTCDTVMQSVTAPKGVDLVRYDEGHGRELPWLAAPSLSADGLFLAAERYAESADPADAELWGVVAVNTQDGTEQEVAAGASQPAWRPAPALDPAALPFVEPGERMVTLNPPLRDGGKVVRISYMTTGDIRRSDGGFLHVASPAFFADQEITGLVVTADGRPVTDPATVGRLLMLYHAAYHLYLDPLPDLVPLLGEELDTVLSNPLVIAMKPEKFLTSRRNQVAATLRAMLTVRGIDDPIGELFDQAMDGTSTNAQAALDALGEIIEDQHASNAALAAVHADLEAAYQASSDTVAWGTGGLKLLRLAGDLIFLGELQSERAAWLESYVETFPGGDAGLDRDQLRAAATVMEEVDQAKQQRGNLLVDFVTDETIDLLLKTGTELTQPAAADLVAQVAAKYGASLSSQAVASLLSAVSVGLTVNGILFGADELVGTFQIAKQAEELRGAFRAAVDEMQRQSADVPPFFDGNAAAAYRTAVLLDTLAGVTAQRAYADGVVASQRIPNPLKFLNVIRGEDWEAAADGLRVRADDAERKVLGDLTDGATVDAAVTLVRPDVSRTEAFVEPVTGIAFVYVPEGEFVMGSSDAQVEEALALCNRLRGYCERKWFESEQPQHTVYLDDYWIMQTEVTNAQYRRFVEAGGYDEQRYWSEAGWTWRSDGSVSEPGCLDDEDFNADDQPVVCVSWYEAEAFATWLSEASGRTVRLPTEAEWEKAARGTDGGIYPWGDMEPNESLANYDMNIGRTTPVGSYLDGASPYGALDMAGNVWEWTADWYDEPYYATSPTRNPTGPETGEWRVMRGGSFDEPVNAVLCAFRFRLNPDNRYYVIGFRVVAAPIPLDSGASGR